MKYCPLKDGPALYLDCKECDNRVCESGIWFKQNGFVTLGGDTSQSVWAAWVEMNAKDCCAACGRKLRYPWK